MLFKFRYDKPYMIQRGYRATLVFIEVNKEMVGKFSMELRDTEDFKNGTVKYYGEALLEISVKDPWEKNSDGEYICDTVYAYLCDRSRVRNYTDKSDYDKYKLVSMTPWPVTTVDPLNTVEWKQDLESMGLQDKLALEKALTVEPSIYF